MCTVLVTRWVKIPPYSKNTRERVHMHRLTQRERCEGQVKRLILQGHFVPTLLCDTPTKTLHVQRGGQTEHACYKYVQHCRGKGS